MSNWTGDGTQVLPVPIDYPATDFEAQLAADIADVFFSDFAVPAILTVNGVTTYPDVIFSAPFSAMSPATGQIETTKPEARGATTALATAVHGSTIVIKGVTYKVIGKQPTEDNLEIVLILSKD